MSVGRGGVDGPFRDSASDVTLKPLLSDPLLLQIAIGVGAFLVGSLFGVLLNRSRVRAIRKDGEARVEQLEAELAVERLRITDLRTRVASHEGDRGARVARLEGTGLAGTGVAADGARTNRPAAPQPASGAPGVVPPRDRAYPTSLAESLRSRR
jgi:hypothetical protein